MHFSISILGYELMVRATGPSPSARRMRRWEPFLFVTASFLKWQGMLWSPSKDGLKRQPILQFKYARREEV